MIGNIEKKLKELGLPIEIVLWDGTRIGSVGIPQVKLSLKSQMAVLALSRPTLGKLARAYVRGTIDIEGDARQTLALGEKLVSDTSATYKKRLDFLKRWRHTKPADRQSIQSHYDVGNEFYGLWLDRQRVYSCGYFKKDSDTLDKAQEQKLDHICKKLVLKPGEKMLDIGCGWGALITWAAKHYGVEALGITLSEQQHAYAKEKIKRLGLEDTCRVELLDYRDLSYEGYFDKVSSVGMFEHVGKGNLPIYFEKIYSLLKPGGLVMNHGITTNSTNDHALGSDIGNFVDEYVFPGGELVHVSTVLKEVAQSGIEVWDAESLRPHYAKTLWYWVDRLEKNESEAKSIIGEERYRIWRIYMAGSAHAFERGWISIFQILGTKPLGSGKVSYPLTRQHIYP
jgi:cyclopropane-fatty-acyl-phospholipid synthase